MASKTVLFLISNSVFFPNYMSFVEKHDRGELVRPCAGRCKGHTQPCARPTSSLSLHQRMCLFSMWWKTTHSCRLSWCRCWWNTLGFRKPPSGLWNTVSPGISFPAGYGTRSRISHLIISEWQRRRASAIPGKQTVVRSGTSTDVNCLLLTTSFLTLYLLLLSLLIHTSSCSSRRC